jgi:8-hydroxy-5-deazaflavin:NADPH oxidoreductase
MKIGIIGTGNIGSNLARLFVKAGHQVILSWSRSPEKLIQLSLELGNHQTAKAASVLEAVHDVDITVLAARFVIMDEIKKQAGDVTNKIIIDTNNPYDIKLAKGVSAAQEVQRRFTGAKIVKAYNSLYFELLQKNSFSNPLTIMPVCSDDVIAKNTVSKLITETGFQPFDLGGLENVHLQEPDGAFYNKALTLDEAKEIWGSI